AAAGPNVGQKLAAEGLWKVWKAARQEPSAAELEHRIAAHEPLPHRVDGMIRDVCEGFFQAVKLEQHIFAAVVLVPRFGMLEPLAKEIESLFRLVLSHQSQHALRMPLDLAQMHKVSENNVRLPGGERRERRAFLRQEPNEIDPARITPFGEIFDGRQE